MTPIPPCPFCGRMPRLIPKVIGGFYPDQYRCDHCDYAVEIKVWMQRVPPTDRSSETSQKS